MDRGFGGTLWIYSVSPKVLISHKLLMRDCYINLCFRYFENKIKTITNGIIVISKIPTLFISKNKNYII